MSGSQTMSNNEAPESELQKDVQYVMDTHHLDSDSLRRLNAIKSGIAELEAENARLRELTECAGCGEPPDWNITPICAGWMPHYCPSCQAEDIYGVEP